MPTEDIQTPEAPATEPTPTTPEPIRNPDSVLKALEAERTARKELEKKIKAFEGIDPAKYQEYTAAEAKREQEKAEAERKRLEERGAYEQLTAKQREEHQRELKAIQDRLDALTAEKDAIANQAKEKETAIARMKLEGKALKAFLAEGGESEEEFSEFLWSRISKYVVQTEDGGIQILDDGGNLRLDDKKNPLNLRGFFAQFKEGRGAKFFKPTNTAEGSGMPPTGKSPAQSPGKSIRRSDLSSPSALRKAGISLEDIASGSVKIIDG